MSTVDITQKFVEQLRAEANIERVKMSIACQDLIRYCQDHEAGDKLVLGLCNGPNPYREEECCVTL